MSTKIRFAPLPDRNTANSAGDHDPMLLCPESHKERRRRSPSPPLPDRSPSLNGESLSRKSPFLQVFRPKDDNALTRTTCAGSSGVLEFISKSPSQKSAKPPPSPTVAAADGLLASVHSSRTPNHRMLNGRVYGAKKDADDSEPAFVEWGYGGMGSVKSQQQVGGRMWGKVQSESGIVGIEDDDDGSGIGWLKRRKEARERKALEDAAQHLCAAADKR